MTAWAQGCDDIRAVALIGSHARGAARPDSDINLVLLARDPRKFFSDEAWLQAIDWQGIGVRPLYYQDVLYGACTSRHVDLENGLEVEFGFVPLSWAHCSLVDDDTGKVVSEACDVLYDPDARLANLFAPTLPDAMLTRSIS